MNVNEENEQYKKIIEENVKYSNIFHDKYRLLIFILKLRLKISILVMHLLIR